jgi:hypothetical protein
VSQLFANGHIVDLILGLMVVEALALIVYQRWTGRGIAPLDLLSNLLAGLCLLLALRAALVGAAWGWIAAWLSVALVAHLIDVQRRWKTQTDHMTGRPKMWPAARNVPGAGNLSSTMPDIKASNTSQHGIWPKPP